MKTTYPCTRRRSFRALALGAASVCLIGLAGCGTPVVADGGLLARADALLRGGQPGEIKLLLSPDTVATGDALAAQVQSRLPGRLYLYQVGTDGKTLNLVFPNELDGQNAIGANSLLNLPRPHWRLRARGPAGVGYLIAVVTQEEQVLSTLAKAAGDGRFQVDGRYAAAMATLTERAPR